MRRSRRSCYLYRAGRFCPWGYTAHVSFTHSTFHVPGSHFTHTSCSYPLPAILSPDVPCRIINHFYFILRFDSFDNLPLRRCDSSLFARGSPVVRDVSAISFVTTSSFSHHPSRAISRMRYKFPLFRRSHRFLTLLFWFTSLAFSPFHFRLLSRYSPHVISWEVASYFVWNVDAIVRLAFCYPFGTVIRLRIFIRLFLHSFCAALLPFSFHAWASLHFTCLSRRRHRLPC